MSAAPGPGGLWAQLEDDVRRLMREAGELRFAAAENEREGAARTRRGLLSLIEVLDAFDRVLGSVEARPEAASPPVKAWLGNFRSVRKLLERHLLTEGVERFQSLDRVFDPALQQVVDVVSDAGRAEGSVVREDEPGYRWREEILRKARVAVVKNA